jgi:hypothetical protein
VSSGWIGVFRGISRASMGGFLVLGGSKQTFDLENV